jgi:hypothetical protein
MDIGWERISGCVSGRPRRMAEHRRRAEDETGMIMLSVCRERTLARGIGLRVVDVPP